MATYLRPSRFVWLEGIDAREYEFRDMLLLLEREFRWEGGKEYTTSIPTNLFPSEGVVFDRELCFKMKTDDRSPS